MEAKRSCWPTWMVSPTNQPGGCLMVSEMLRSCIAFVVSSFQAVALLSNVAHIVWRSIKYASEVCCAVWVCVCIPTYYTTTTTSHSRKENQVGQFLLSFWCHLHEMAEGGVAGEAAAAVAQQQSDARGQTMHYDMCYCIFLVYSSITLT